MKYAFSALLLVATLGFAKPQSQTPPSSPPYTTPPTFPEGRQNPDKQMPPDQEAPPPKRSSASQVEQHIQNELNAEPTLRNTTIDVKADESAVTLTGTVNTVEQHDLAIKIAHSYGGSRKIVDKIKRRNQT